MDDTLAHWLIAQLYLKVSYETKSLLDPGIYFNHVEKLAALGKFYRWIKCANVSVVALILALGYCVFIGSARDDEVAYFVGNYG